MDLLKLSEAQLGKSWLLMLWIIFENVFLTNAYFLNICPVVKQFQEYTEPGGEDGTPQRRGEDEESVLLPLGDNTLTHNLGIPVVVVCTKVHTLTLF